MAVVLCKSPAAEQAVNGPGQLVAVDGTQFEESAWKVPVAPLPALEDGHVERAVHGLRVVGRPVHLHWRVHPVGVEVEVPARLPQNRLGDVGAVNEVVPAGLVTGPAVVLNQFADQGSLGMPYSQARTERLGPRHKVQLCGQAAVVPLFGLGQAVQVAFQSLLVGPRCAVDPLEHGLPLIAPPVGTSHLLKGEVAETSGGRNVRAGTQVDEPVSVAVVGDSSVGGSLASQLGVSITAGDLFDDLALEPVIGKQFERIIGSGLEALEGLVGIDDQAHPGLDGLQVVLAECAATG